MFKTERSGREILAQNINKTTRTPNPNHAISVGKDLQPNTRPNVRPGVQYAGAAEKNDISLNAVTARKLPMSSNRSQMKNKFKQRRNLLSLNDLRIIHPNGNVKNLEIFISAYGKTKCLRTTLKTRGSLFSTTIDTGSPASFVNKRTAETLLPKDPNARIISLDKCNIRPNITQRRSVEKVPINDWQASVTLILLVFHRLDLAS